MSWSTWSKKPLMSPVEARLEDGFQDAPKHVLDDAVDRGRDAERAHLVRLMGFRDEELADRERAEGAGAHRADDLSLPVQPVILALVVVSGLAVVAWGTGALVGENMFDGPGDEGRAGHGPEETGQGPMLLNAVRDAVLHTKSRPLRGSGRGA